MFVSQQPVRRRNIQIKWGVVIAVIHLCGSVALAQPRFSEVPSTQFGEAKQILRTLYPELSGRRMSITYSVSVGLDSDDQLRLNQFDVTVSQFAPSQQVPISGSLKIVLPGESVPKNFSISAGFLFDSKGRLERFTAAGDWPLNDDKNQKARELVDAHPAWTDEQIIGELKVAGAKYAPTDKQALIKEIPINGLSPFLGKAKVTSAEFDFRDPETANRAATLHWQVEVEAVDERGMAVRYLLSVEPFGGKINYLRKVAGD